VETYRARLGQPTLVTWKVPDVIDNSGSETALVSDVMPGSLFPVGVTKVTYTASDAAGIQMTCSFHVIVLGECSAPFGNGLFYHVVVVTICKRKV
jgi:hypothetical protein